ncbi:MAG: type II secretion system protein [Neisseria sp.]|nr:type II secretion system protein [Neisseria sp.]
MRRKILKTAAQQGFSLIEMLAAAAIVGILAVAALNAYSKHLEKRDLLTMESHLRGIFALIQTASLEDAAYPVPPDNNEWQRILSGKALSCRCRSEYRIAPVLAEQYRIAPHQSRQGVFLSAEPSDGKRETVLLVSEHGQAERCGNPAAARQYMENGQSCPPH